jgi:hypothetical protein
MALRGSGIAADHGHEQTEQQEPAEGRKHALIEFSHLGLQGTSAVTCAFAANERHFNCEKSIERISILDGLVFLLCLWHDRIGDRAALAGIVYQLHTGIPTHLLPAEHPALRQPDPVLGATDGDCL